jgi:SAM-dependent methyltransferase
MKKEMRDYSARVKPALSSKLFITEAASALRRFCLGLADRREVDRLVKLAAQIARAKLWGRLSAAAKAQGTSIEQLALSVIGGLFSGGSDAPLGKALIPALESDDVSLFLRFKAVVVRTATQELFHRWHETDPTSARLWRNLQRAVRHDGRLAVFPHDRPEWVTLAAKTESKADLNCLEHNDLASAVAKCGYPSSGLADYIANILRLCEQDRGAGGAVRIDALFAILRESMSAEILADLNAKGNSFCLDPDIQMAVGQAKRVALNNLHVRLEKYTNDGKLPPALVKAFGAALIDLLEDCVDGGPAQSYFDYLRPHAPELPEEEYRRAYRSRFEYLAEKIQESFFDDMRKRLGQ